MGTPASAVPDPLPARPPSTADVDVPDVAVPTPRRPAGDERIIGAPAHRRTTPATRPVGATRRPGARRGLRAGRDRRLPASSARRSPGAYRRRLPAVVVTLLVGLALLVGALTASGGPDRNPAATVTAATATATATATAPSLVEAAAPGPVDTVMGTWTGLLFDPATSSLDVRLRVDDGSLVLDIPSLDCRYAGSRDVVGDIPVGEARTAELATTDNPQDLCAARAEVRLTRLSTHALRYELLRTCETTRGRCTTRAASAVLTRPGG